MKAKKIIDLVLKEATNFTSPEAYKKYKQEHPNFNPKKHKVVNKEKRDVRKENIKNKIILTDKDTGKKIRTNP